MSDEPITIAIDRAECIGSGQCLSSAPGVFRFDQSMKAEVIDPMANELGDVLEAAELCPTQAIYISRGRVSIYP